MSRSLHAARFCLLLTVIWTGVGGSTSSRAADRTSAAPASSMAMSFASAGAAAASESALHPVEPAAKPAMLAASSFGFAATAMAAPHPAPVVTQRPTDLFSLDDFKRSFSPPVNSMPAARNYSAPSPPASGNAHEPAPFSLADAHPQLTGIPAGSPNGASAVQPSRIPQSPPGIISSVTPGVSSNPSLPPILSPDSLPRKGSSSSARVAIADSSRSSASPSQDPAGGSAPLRPSQRVTPQLPEMLMRTEIAPVPPPVPNLAEAPPPQRMAFSVPPPSMEEEAPAVSEGATPRFVPQIRAPGGSGVLATIAPSELPPAFQGVTIVPNTPNTTISPLVSSAATRMKADHEAVEVFYGTDRYPDNFDGEAPMIVLFRFTPAIVFVILTTLLLGLTLYRSCRLWWCVATGMTATVSLGLIWYAAGITAYNTRELAKQGPRYGKQRGEFTTGICRVTIPRVHQTGMLEAPSILKLEVREDVRKHVILQQVSQLPQDEFYRKLQHRVAQSERRELFIFIHGYNVTFEDAARRAAQMHYDLDYQGAPIFYSWPSQGELWKYTIDETNVAWTAPHFKQFVRDIAAYSGAKSINLIAHSMGNRAMTYALRDIALEMREDQKIFNQVVLAAPDIDAEVFKRDIAPQIMKTAENVTLYASAQDHALIASKLVHGYPRAGESGKNLIVLPGIDTIDVSSVETNFLGHNYYGESDIILADICRLLTDEEPTPEDRQWLTPAPANGNLVYWVFQGARAASCMPRALR